MLDQVRRQIEFINPEIFGFSAILFKKIDISQGKLLDAFYACSYETPEIYAQIARSIEKSEIYGSKEQLKIELCQKLYKMALSQNLSASSQEGSQKQQEQKEICFLLPLEARAIFYLKHRELYSFKQIQGILDIPLEDVISSYHRSLSQLASLEPELYKFSQTENSNCPHSKFYRNYLEGFSLIEEDSKNENTKKGEFHRKHLAECDTCLRVYENSREFFEAVTALIPKKNIPRSLQFQFEEKSSKLAREMTPELEETWSHKLKALKVKSIEFLKDFISVFKKPFVLTVLFLFVLFVGLTMDKVKTFFN